VRPPRIAALLFLAAAQAPAGGRLETFDITGLEPTPIPGHVAARLVGIRWDARTIPVRYSMNTTLDPVPNPLGPAFLTLADAQAALQRSFDTWNAVPTSYIEMRVAGTTANPGACGFDMVNELTFRTAAGFDAIASSPSVSLIADTVLVDGDDIDGDGDSDVSAAITSARDVDGDGDIELPAGFYKAGTILDNDVQFNTKPSSGLRFTVRDEDADMVRRSVDLMAVAVHEFGHSLGLSHVLTNQLSPTDGTGATMFPFVDTGDPASELAQRSLDTDDVAWSSYLYPEGTARRGPAALQKGDVPFRSRFGLAQGTLRHGVLGEPIAGGSLFATSVLTRRITGSAFSGTTRLSLDPATGGLYLVSPEFDVVDGRWTMPLPLGLYTIGVQAVDGSPVPAASVSLTAQIGAIFGQQEFDEELWGGPEGAPERSAGAGRPIQIVPGFARGGIDIVTSRTVDIGPFGDRDAVGFVNQPPGGYYAVQVPAAEILAARPGEGFLLHSALFDTYVADASVVPRFAEALLTTGVVGPDGTATLDLASPLARSPGFLGRDDDFAPFFFPNPQALGQTVRERIETGEIQNLFLVLRLPTATPFPGLSGLPPVIGLDGGVAHNDAPILGRSFVSADGASFTRDTRFNFRFTLVLSEPSP
jgi:hypothetical protein